MGKQKRDNPLKTNFYIDVNNSINKGWLTLTYKESWVNKFDRFSFFLLFVALLTYPTIIIIDIADYSSPNDRAFSLILGLIILFAIYGLYRKIFENRLIIIQTDLPKDKIKSLLTDYLEKKRFEFKVSKNCIIGRQAESLSFNKMYNKNITFIFDDSYLGFVATKEFLKVNPPVFFTHYLIQKDLKKLLTQ